MLTKEQVARIPLRLTVPHYLHASYGYYYCDDSVMTDDAFDALCARMLRNYDSIDHEHKSLVDRGSLEAGTCLLAIGDFPLRVSSGYERYRAMVQDGSLVRQMRLDSAEPARRIVRRPAPVDAAPPAVRRGIRRPSPVQEEAETPARPAARRVVSRRS